MSIQSFTRRTTLLVATFCLAPGLLVPVPLGGQWECAAGGAGYFLIGNNEQDFLCGFLGEKRN